MFWRKKPVREIEEPREEPIEEPEPHLLLFSKHFVAEHDNRDGGSFPWTIWRISDLVMKEPKGRNTFCVESAQNAADLMKRMDDVIDASPVQE